MKIFPTRFLFFALLFFQQLQAQNGVWTWMHGTTANNPLGNFGTIGVPAPSNDPPGMYEPATWTDQNGNFWMLGGYSANNMQTALWKFDPVANVWIWMNGPSAFMQPGVYGTIGVADPANHPGCRAYGCITWTDAQNNLWLFGGFGYDGFSIPGVLNDLWKYNIATNEWTWVNGSNNANPTGSYGTIQVPAASNQPPPRCSFTGWVDQNGDLWFYGGYDFNTFNCYSDMWRYSIASNTWTWMSGSNSINASPDYGTIKVPAATNTPGARTAYSKWTDANGKFWLFGGFQSNVDAYGDMWEYDPQTNFWTWMAGTAIPDDTGWISNQCYAGTDNLHVRCDNSVNWMDGCGRFVSYGGYYRLGNQDKFLDDVWAYDPGTDLFTWIDGTQTPNQTANYGTILVPATTNHPGANAGGVGFQDLSGNYWYFGGDLPPNNIQLKNVMWKYVPDTNCVKYLHGYSTIVPDTICAGSPASFTSSLNHPQYDFYWNFGNPADPNAFSNQANATYTYSDTGTYLVTFWYSSQLASCTNPDRDTFRVVVIDPQSKLIFPNVFTPNGDGLHEVFPDCRTVIEGYSISVYNRWGNLIFETDNSLNNWDGKFNGQNCAPGAYFWKAKLKDCKGELIEKTGFVELIR